MTFVLSLNFNPLMERYSLVLPQTPRTVQDWISLQMGFGDVRIFNPHAPSNRHPRCYRKHELEKKHQYEQRVREIERVSFTPLVLSATGGMANEATVFYKRLASCLATKWDQPYSPTMSSMAAMQTHLLTSSVSDPMHQGCPL